MFPVSCVGAALVVCVRSDALRLTFASHTVSFHSSLHGLRLESSLWLTLMCCSRGRKPFTSQTVSLNMHYISFQMFFSTSPYHLGYCCYTTAKLPIVRHAHCDVLCQCWTTWTLKLTAQSVTPCFTYTGYTDTSDTSDTSNTGAKAGVLQTYRLHISFGPLCFPQWPNISNEGPDVFVGVQQHRPAWRPVRGRRTRLSVFCQLLTLHFILI